MGQEFFLSNFGFPQKFVNKNDLFTPYPSIRQGLSVCRKACRFENMADLRHVVLCRLGPKIMSPGKFRSGNTGKVYIYTGLDEWLRHGVFHERKATDTTYSCRMYPHALSLFSNMGMCGNFKALHL